MITIDQLVDARNRYRMIANAFDHIIDLATNSGPTAPARPVPAPSVPSVPSVPSTPAPKPTTNPIKTRRTKLATIRERILELIAAEGDKEWSATHIADKARCPRSTTTGYISKLKAMGAIERVKSGWYKSTSTLPIPTPTKGEQPTDSPTPKTELSELEEDYRKFRATLDIKPIPEVRMLCPEGRGDL
jgi:predicted transcriptional regulator